MNKLSVYSPGKYGRAACLAVSLFRFGEQKSIEGAWDHAMLEVFPDSPSSRAKGCPKGAFLGLCQEGLVTGIPRGEYTKSQDNRSYALRAIELLQSNSDLECDPKQLWSKVMQGEEKVHNSQMDIVLSLWAENLISCKK